MYICDVRVQCGAKAEKVWCLPKEATRQAISVQERHELGSAAEVSSMLSRASSMPSTTLEHFNS